MARLLHLPAHEWRDIPTPAEQAKRNRADFEATSRRCNEANAAHERSIALRDRTARRRKRARTCRDVVVALVSAGLCGFLMVGPSLMDLGAYLALLALAAVGAVAGVARAARIRSADW